MKDERKFSSFILLWATQTLSRLGSSLTPFALILWAYGKTGSALSTALLTVSSYVPYILLSLPVGTLTDRMNKNRNADRQDEQEASDAVIGYSRGIMHAHDTLRVALRES